MPGNGAQPRESPTSFGAAQKFRSAQVCSEASAPSSHHPITPHSPTTHADPASPCPGDCGNGTCDSLTGTCQCPRGYYGPYCHLRSECTMQRQTHTAHSNVCILYSLLYHRNGIIRCNALRMCLNELVPRLFALAPSDECEDSSDCSNSGVCVNILSTNVPTRQCFCYSGYHGPRCQFSECSRTHMQWVCGEHVPLGCTEYKLDYQLQAG